MPCPRVSPRANLAQEEPSCLAERNTARAAGKGPNRPSSPSTVLAALRPSAAWGWLLQGCSVLFQRDEVVAVLVALQEQGVDLVGKPESLQKRVELELVEPPVAVLVAGREGRLPRSFGWGRRSRRVET